MHIPGISCVSKQLSSAPETFCIFRPPRAHWNKRQLSLKLRKWLLDEHDSLLVYCAMLSHRSWPTFQRCLLPPSSWRWLISPNMEAVSTSETSVNFYETAWLSIPKGYHLHTRCHQNLRSHTGYLIFAFRLSSLGCILKIKMEAFWRYRTMHLHTFINSRVRWDVLQTWMLINLYVDARKCFGSLAVLLWRTSGSLHGEMKS
jgi:hypothetical protein